MFYHHQQTTQQTTSTNYPRPSTIVLMSPLVLLFLPLPIFDHLRVLNQVQIVVLIDTIYSLALVSLHFTNE